MSQPAIASACGNTRTRYTVQAKIKSFDWHGAAPAADMLPATMPTGSAERH
jgi:hypothetical protein